MHCHRTTSAPPAPVVLITGATGGIGRAVALAYAGRGAKLTLNPLMRLGFALVPGLFDAVVGPLLHRLALAEEPRQPTEGNVFRPSQDVAG